MKKHVAFFFFCFFLVEEKKECAFCKHVFLLMLGRPCSAFSLHYVVLMNGTAFSVSLMAQVNQFVSIAPDHMIHISCYRSFMYHFARGSQNNFSWLICCHQTVKSRFS